MIKIILFGILFSLPAAGKSLKIEFLEMPEEEGKAMLALYNSKENYKEEDHPFMSQECERSALETQSCQFEKLEKGTYALAVFWDEDGDKKLDTNIVGYPSEPFGFSQNPTILIGKPGFRSTKFDFDGGPLTLKIKLK